MGSGVADYLSQLPEPLQRETKDHLNILHHKLIELGAEHLNDTEILINTEQLRLSVKFPTDNYSEAPSVSVEIEASDKFEVDPPILENPREYTFELLAANDSNFARFFKIVTMAYEQANQFARAHHFEEISLHVERWPYRRIFKSNNSLSREIRTWQAWSNAKINQGMNAANTGLIETHMRFVEILIEELRITNTVSVKAINYIWRVFYFDQFLS